MSTVPEQTVLNILACDGLQIFLYNLLITGSLILYKMTPTIPRIRKYFTLSHRLGTNMSQTSATWVITGYVIDHHLFDYLSAHVLNINVEVTVD